SRWARQRWAWRQLWASRAWAYTGGRGWRCCLLETSLSQWGRHLGRGRWWTRTGGPCWRRSAGLGQAGRCWVWRPDRQGPRRRLRELVVDGLRDHDVLVTSGGVSVGTHDLVKPLLESLGEVHLGRVRLKPGKPFTFATLPFDRLAFGLPGFPVSSLVTFEV